MKAIIVIPTYNEKDNIGPLVEEVFKVIPDIHILIVDDNSPDGTGIIVDELSKKYAQVKILHRKRKEGLGRAYIAGFKEALKFNPDYILQMDADFSHHPKYIPILLKEIENYDFVLGSRFLNKRKRAMNVSRFSVWANHYTRFVLNLKISDCLGGFKCFRREVLDIIDLNQFISKGYIFQTEFLYRALKKGFSVHEIPIIFYRRKSGTSKKNKIIILEAFFRTPLFRFL